MAPNLPTRFVDTKEVPFSQQWNPEEVAIVSESDISEWQRVHGIVTVRDHKVYQLQYSHHFGINNALVKAWFHVRPYNPLEHATNK